MAIDVATFRVRFPEFSDPIEFPDDRIQLFLDDARDLYMGVDENHWCGKYNTAQAYLGAHLLVKGTAQEAGDTSASIGPVSQKSAGGVSVTKAVSNKERSDQGDFFASTTYGLQYISIRRTCIVEVAVAI